MKWSKDFLGLVAITLFVSCQKEDIYPVNTEREFQAIVMQNKIYRDEISFMGYYYAIQEHGENFVHTRYPSIIGFDSLYVEGFQYQLKLREVCSHDPNPPMDTRGCELYLLSVLSQEKQEEDFVMIFE